MRKHLDIPGWVLKARRHAGLSQEELAAKLILTMGSERGYTKANMSHWEKGRHSPNIEQVLAIADITRYPLPFPSSTTSTDPLLAEAVMILAQLDQSVRLKALELLKVFTASHEQQEESHPSMKSRQAAA